MDEDSLPEPLTPENCDLRSYDWFPLYFKRLKRSSFWIRASGDVAKASVDLWCEAYEQVPAGSMPDDDMALAMACGFGRRDLDAWLEIKDDVMSAWTLCSDGRWYHQTLCEIIMETWTNRLTQREKERLKKQAQRKAKVPRDNPNVPRGQHECPEGTNPKSPGTSDMSLGKTPDVPECPSPTRQDRTGQNRTEGIAPNGAVDAGAPTVPEDAVLPLVLDADTRTDVQKVSDRWNAMVDHVNQFQPDELKLAKVLKVDGTRLKALQARLREYGLDSMLTAIETVAFSRFLRGGENDRGRTWRADFDFLVQAKSCRKVIEGVWPRNMNPSKELAHGEGTGTGGREAQHSERVRDNWSAAMDGLD